MKTKRKPLLIDEFLSAKMIDWPDKEEHRRFSAVREHMREAKVFVLDEQAAHYAAEFIRDHPEAIAYDQEFAIPPFPRMYIELPYPDFFHTLGGRNEHDPIYGDTEVGYFIDGPRAYTLSRVRNGTENEAQRKLMGATSMIMPIAYKLNQPFSPKEEQEVCDRLGVSRIGIDLLYWGSSVDINWKGGKRDDWRELDVTSPPEAVVLSKYAAMLRANHSFEQWYARDLPHVLSGLFTSAAGDLRNIIALILFLNRTADVRFDEQMPPHRGWIGPRPALFTKHNVVRIRLDPKSHFVKTYGGHGAWRRRHEVRAHFCHDSKARAHHHHLIPQPFEEGYHQAQWTEHGVNQWHCLICGGRRWHRKACSRGSKDKGAVVKTYEVTK